MSNTIWDPGFSIDKVCLLTLNMAGPVSGKRLPGYVVILPNAFLFNMAKRCDRPNSKFQYFSVIGKYTSLVWLAQRCSVIFDYVSCKVS